ncbi:S-adenosyl-L-methionine-dependent methyltransferase [Gilbertella persicaria]|uniref:S-adenosyl-L-methionine-dependent methyltransferase n=1 Tax=Gilbertella persicaria TaxID=101096 RepID=UPI00221FDF8B|nr:S-adenosyl-L-methionine-dependent methyltransferase [Gilbertella persicaria]KAI8053685.1 S-adenosyl-L-methionine-dependent methyltransferase [Gilbertella persicaria]
MKLKELESILQDCKVFEQPKIQFEQYPTTPHLAARMLYTADTVYDDVENKAVGDFGCGCGILSIAANILGAGIGFDIDSDAIQISQENCEAFEVEMDFINTDLSEAKLDEFRGKLDTIIMNPPFGTKSNKGIDMVLLKKAVEVAGTAVYSLHKTSTRDHIEKKAKEWGVTFEVVAELKFDVPMMYKFHKKKNVEIAVDFLRFEKQA